MNSRGQIKANGGQKCTCTDQVQGFTVSKVRGYGVKWQGICAAMLVDAVVQCGESKYIGMVVQASIILKL
jgi:hypothetical protein